MELTLEVNQLNLFSDTKPTPGRRAKILVMSADALLKWKAEILEYQQRVRTSQSPKQATLFDLAPTHCDLDAIDPLSLRLVPMSFYRMPVDYPGEACLYFVVDTAASLVLYVGETLRSNKRWKGEHGCKQYLDSYHSLHQCYELQRSVGITFWWDAPVERRARQALEQAMIQKWRTPFNKENWERWGQPFK